ncbi:hypothetical protein BGZ70_002857 [Mortierella alpina]|uniref:Uncharacterized protein n=1 Tax=Mortierella alpina TaxID=64518 RepID=A0A9P6ITU2_MORAP|nr:hypothetical protein BGZ70_002857 [Mortierella alpina]
MQLTVFAFAALVSAVAAANPVEWPKECKYIDGVACYRYCAMEPDGGYKVPTEAESLCYNTDPSSPIEKGSYEYSRVHMRLPEEIAKASPVANMRLNVCQFYSIRCLRRVELGDVPSCAESYFRCKEQEDADVSDKRATSLRAELCQRFRDIDAMYSDAIQAVKDVQTDNQFTQEDQSKKVEALKVAQKEFDTRREVSCEGTANRIRLKDPKTGPTGN